jgi:IclR family acetate operon transcriptional repressor
MRPLLFAIREGKHALFIDHADTNRVIAVAGQTGELVPLYCTAHGKALLADCGRSELKAIFGSEKLSPFTKQTMVTIEQLAKVCAQTKSQGFATDDGELSGRNPMRRCIDPLRRERNHRVDWHFGSPATLFEGPLSTLW